MNFGHFFSIIAKFQFHFISTSFPTHTLHLTPLSLSPSYGRPSGHEGTPHPHIFARKPSTSIIIPTSLQRSQNYKFNSFANFPFLLHFNSREELSPKSLSFLNPNPSSKITPSSSPPAQITPLKLGS